MYHKLKLFVSAGLARWELFVRVMLRCIELQKERFILELEQGQEVLIPRELG